jgi:excisionase family DNA binding protein
MPPITLYTVAELAEILKVSEKTIRREIDRRKLPVVRVGINVRVTHTALETYLSRKVA